MEQRTEQTSRPTETPPIRLAMRGDAKGRSIEPTKFGNSRRILAREWGRCGKYAGELVPDDAIAFTGGCFQPRAIDHRQAAVAVGDQPVLLERLRGEGDAWPAHAEHHGE